MHKRITALFLALIMTLALCGCGNQQTVSGPVEEAAPAESTQEEPKEITITDVIGREVTVVPGSYKRVVCVGAGALRIYSYIGDLSLLCGVEDIDNLSLKDRPKMFDPVARPYVLAYGDVFETLPSCGVGGPNAQQAEAEKLLSCNPDIIVSIYNDVEKEDAMQTQLGIPVVTVMSGPNGVFEESFRKSLTMLGTLFGREDRAKELIDFIDAQTAEITERTANIPDTKKKDAYICGLGNWGTTNHLMTVQNYVTFNVANVRNVVTDLEKDGVQPIEEEKFVSLGGDMDVIFMDTAAVKNIAPLYAENPTMFDTCKAWQDGEVYLQMAYNAYYTNYEINLINAWFIAKTVYPEAFEDVDMTDKTNEITNAFLGKELAEEIFACPVSFGGYGKIDTESFFK